jgi:hypothetical protein
MAVFGRNVRHLRDAHVAIPRPQTVDGRCRPRGCASASAPPAAAASTGDRRAAEHFPRTSTPSRWWIAHAPGGPSGEPRAADVPHAYCSTTSRATIYVPVWTLYRDPHRVWRGARPSTAHLCRTSAERAHRSPCPVRFAAVLRREQCPDVAPQPRQTPGRWRPVRRRVGRHLPMDGQARFWRLAFPGENAMWTRTTRAPELRGQIGSPRCMIRRYECRRQR